MATKSPFCIVFPSKAVYQDQVAKLLPFEINYPLHPTQLYELIGVLIGLLVLEWLTIKIKLKEGCHFLLVAT